MARLKAMFATLKKGFFSVEVVAIMRYFSR